MTWRTSYEPTEIVHALRRRMWLVLVPLWLTAVGTVAYTHRLPDRFESDIRIQLVPANLSVSTLASGSPTTVQPQLQSRLTAITAMVLNSARLRQVVEELSLYRGVGVRMDADPVAQIRRDFRVRVDSPDTFVVTYTAGKAATARAVAERLGAAFVDENRMRSEAAAGAAGDFLDSQLAETRARLEATEQQLAAYNALHAGQMPAQIQSNLQMLQSTQLQLQAVRDALARDRDEAAALDSAIEGASAGTGTLLDGPPPGSGASAAAGPAQELDAARRDLLDLESHLKPQHPDVVRARRRVADLEARLASAPVANAATTTATQGRPAPAPDPRIVQMKANSASLQRQIAARRTEELRFVSQIEDYRRRVEATPGNETELTRLTRDYGTVKDLYGRLLGRKEDARIAAKLQGDQIGERFLVTSAATLPSAPASPNRLQLNVVGTLAGLLVGLALAALFEYRDTSIRTAGDLSAALQFPVLAAIPVLLPEASPWRLRIGTGARWLATAGGFVATAAVLWRFTR